jgi:exosome complex component RRP43
LRGLPIAVTALVFRAKEQAQSDNQRYWILVDPDSLEESLCEESVTVVVDCGNGNTKLCGISKSGGTIVGKEEMVEIVSIAEGRWNGLNLLLKG